MKKTIFTFLLAVAGLGASAQTLPNGNMENWTATSYGETPTGWFTADSLLAFLGASATGTIVRVDVAIEPTNVHGGNHAVGFKTIKTYLPVFADTVTAGGVMLLGNIDFMTENYIGIPFSGHPTALTGYYKLPANGVGDYIAVYGEFKATGGAIMATIEEGLNVEGPNYQSFNFPISWNSSANADSIVLSFELTNDTADNHMGVEAFLDDLAFSYPSGIKENLGASSYLKCYPNPARNVLYVENTSKEALTMSIMDVSGKEYLRTAAGAQKTQLDVSGLSNGVYFYQFRNNKGETVYGGKITIAH
jgi:hypothetical protein